MRRCSNDTPVVVRHLWHGTQIVQDRGHGMRLVVRRLRVVVGQHSTRGQGLSLWQVHQVAAIIIELFFVEGPAAALRTPR